MDCNSDNIRTTSAKLEMQELLKKPVSELLGVSALAANALKKIGISTIFDLGTSNVFATARTVLGLKNSASISTKTGLVPGDLITEDSLNTSPEVFGDKTLDKLRILTPAIAQELSTALDVNTIRDFALWPPSKSARRIVGESIGSSPDPEELGAEALKPRMGEYPTERVYYTSLVMLQMEKGATQIPLDGQVSIDSVIQNPNTFNKPAIGALLTFSQSWYAQGITLGHLLHSLALAPGEATRIAILDWSRKTRATSSESISESEDLDNSTYHGRAVSEIQSAVANEMQQGGSHSSSSANSSSQSIASAASADFLVASADVSATMQGAQSSATADSSSWSSGNRSVLASMSQQVCDRTEQHSSNVRNRRATAVREVSQSEHEKVSTRVVANYNHMHALTVQYYELIQVYRTVCQLHRAERVLFVPLQILDFSPQDVKKGMRVVERFKGALIGAALNRNIQSILFDDTTAVTIKPVTPISAILGAMPTTITATANVTSTATPTSITTHLTPTPVVAGVHPVSETKDVKNFLKWDTNKVANISKILCRSVIRRNSDAIHLPDGTEIISIGFDNLTIKTIVFDHIGADPSANENLIFTPESGSMDLKTPIQLNELEAIHVAKAATESDTGTMVLKCRYFGRVFDLPPIPIKLGAGTAIQKVVSFISDQPDRQRELLTHLQNNQAYYNRAIFRALDSATLTMILSQYQWNGKPLIDQVEPKPLTIAGNYLILRAPVDDNENCGVKEGTTSQTWGALLKSRGLTFDTKNERFIPVPTNGVFAEAVLGRSNSAEKLDITRFWNWQDSPIPLTPTEIAPVSMASRATEEDLKPGQLSSPVLNILNPTSLPNPTGIDSILKAITDLNFRDMSGLAGTQALVQSGMKETLQAATDAGKLASENMKTEAQKAVALKQIAADLAKTAIGALTGTSVSGTGSVAGISSDGARINHGRDMDSRGIPAPADSSANGSTRVTTNPGVGGTSTGSATNSSSGAGINSDAANKISAYSHEATYADKAALGFSPTIIKAVTSPYTESISEASHAEGNSVFDYNVPGLVPILAQPSSMTCWATVATMMISWRDKQSRSIQSVMDMAGPQYRAKFDNPNLDKQGLLSNEKIAFLGTLGMSGEPPMSYTVSGIRSLLQTYGPLWVTTDEDPTEQFSIHARIITGIFGDETTDGTFLRINDPAGGRQYTESYQTFVEKFESEALDKKRPFRIQVAHFM